MVDDLLYLAAPVVAGLVTFGGYLVARWYGSPALWALRRAPRHAIQSFPEGQPGRIVGIVEAHEGKTVRAPLSGRTCVAYAVRVEECENRGQRGARWKSLVQDFDAMNFVVVDDSGRALVRAAGSWPSPVMDRVRSTGLFQNAGPALETLLNAHGHSSRGVLFNKKLRCEEGVIAVGTRVAVLGIGRRESEPQGDVAVGSYRESPRRLTMECLDDGRLLMSNASATLR
jgi:hypothetical protein